MVRWPARRGGRGLRPPRRSSVGLHLDLGEWDYRDGDWRARYEVLDQETPEAVGGGDRAPAAGIRGAGRAAPDHLDSHQHVHRTEPVAASCCWRSASGCGSQSATLTPGDRLQRGLLRAGRRRDARAGGDNRGGAGPAIEGLRLGVTELACHPAAELDHEATYNNERLQELETLCDPGVRAAIDRCGVSLRSFAEIAADG